MGGWGLTGTLSRWRVEVASSHEGNLAHGQSLPLVAGSGGLSYGSRPVDSQLGSSAFAHGEHI